MENTPLILQATQAIGEFLLGAVHDTLDATVTSIGSIPGQLVGATKYALGVDRFVGEDRPWFKVGTGFRGDFWDGDNGLTRSAERFNHAVFSVVLGGANTLTGGLTYDLVNRRLGVDCPYFSPGPQDAREVGRFFSSGLAMMLMGRQLMRGPGAQVVNPEALAVDPGPMVVDFRPSVPQGPVRLQYAIPNAVEEVAAHIRRGNVVAPSILRKMLEARTPEVLGPVARTAVELVRDGYLPVHVLEGVLWDSHPRTIFLVHYFNEMRVGSPRLAALWRLMKLDAYEIEVLANGDTQLRPMPAFIQDSAAPRAVSLGRSTVPTDAPEFN